MDIDDAIRAEQARLIHRNVPTAVIGGLAVLCVTIAVFSRIVAWPELAAWFAAIAGLSAYRLAVWRKYRRATFTLATSRSWTRHALAAAAVSGTLWGVGWLFVLPADDFAYQLTFVFAAVMMSTAAMFSYSAHYPTFLAFTIPCLAPALYALPAMNTAIHWGIALGILIFLLVASRFTSSFNRMFVESLKLRFENIELVGKLTAQKEAAELANLAKSRFLAAASHDLRQPMHALNLYLGSLDGLELPERARPMVDNLRQCAGAMDGMFRGLLDISRLDAGTVQPEVAVFPIAAILDRVRVEFEPQARAKGLELRVAPSSAWVNTDRALAARVIGNLAANAVAHTARGRILVGCRRGRGTLRVAVYDTGPGIPADQRAAVFEEFYQLGNPERDRAKGIGLGLAIVERLAKLLSAPVTLKSHVGRGSMFAVDLPQVRPERSTAMRLAATEGQRASLAGALVVVVDDEASILDATRTILETWGCTVVTAASGAEAMLVLTSSLRAPDLLLCDYRLRGAEDGVTVIEAVRAEFNDDIPAVLITGDTAPDRIRMIESSGLPVLHKPLREDELHEVLAYLLSARPRASGSEQAEPPGGDHRLGAIRHA